MMSGSAESVMPHPRDYLPTLDRIEAALEASCGALVTLESINSVARDGSDEPDAMGGHVGLAIRSLRDVIEELRLAQSNGACALAIGFVLKGNGRVPRAVDPVPLDPGQPKPRRTA
jgi:hypothetical protein